MTFFLLLLLIFFIWPLIRVVYALWKLRRQSRQAFEQMNNFQAGAAGSARQERRAGWSSPTATPHKKKIDSDTGDYVAYEDIEAAPSAERQAPQSYSGEVESQVSDVEWEDIP
jgi:hypothetical protein